MKNRFGNKGLILNWFVLSYALAILVLILSDKITFGHGLGDLLYLFGIAIMLIVHLVLLLIFNSKRFRAKEKTYNVVIGLFFLMIVLYLTYEFTLGRGSLYKWNGNIFMR